MPYLVVHLVLTFFLDLIQVLARSRQDQILEILVLRQQLRIALHNAPPTPLSWPFSASKARSWHSHTSTARKSGRME